MNPEMFDIIFSNYLFTQNSTPLYVGILAPKLYYTQKLSKDYGRDKPKHNTKTTKKKNTIPEVHNADEKVK